MIVKHAIIRMVTAGYFVLVMSALCVAQERRGTKVLRIPNGKDATKLVSSEDRFFYPEFRYGKLVYQSGQEAAARFNYCLLLGEVMYITPSADTMAIGNQTAVDYVAIGSDVFFFSPGNGYVQLLEDCGSVSLTKKSIYRVAGNEKRGAYNNLNDNGAVANVSSYTDVGGITTRLAQGNTVLLRSTDEYYFFDQNRQLLKAGRTGLLKIFAKYKRQVHNYLAVRNIDFDKEDQLRQVIVDCSQFALDEERTH